MWQMSFPLTISPAPPLAGLPDPNLAVVVRAWFGSETRFLFGDFASNGRRGGTVGHTDSAEFSNNETGGVTDNADDWTPRFTTTHACGF